MVEEVDVFPDFDVEGVEDDEDEGKDGPAACSRAGLIKLVNYIH